jgi:hypothetical protein
MAGILPATLNHEALDLGIASESHQKAVGISLTAYTDRTFKLVLDDTENVGFGSWLYKNASGASVGTGTIGLGGLESTFREHWPRFTS